MTIRVLLVALSLAVLAGCSQRQTTPARPVAFSPKQKVALPSPPNDPLLGPVR
jgi:hypothetical protein